MGADAADGGASTGNFLNPMEIEDSQAFSQMQKLRELRKYGYPHGLSAYLVIVNQGPPAIRVGAKEAGTTVFRHRGVEGVDAVFKGLGSNMGVETLKREITARVNRVLALPAKPPTIQRALPPNASVLPSNPPPNPAPTVRPPTGRVTSVPPLHVPKNRQP